MLENFCLRCGQPATNKLCRRHLDDQKARVKKLETRRKELKMCLRCTGRAAEGTQLCRYHNEHRMIQQRKYRALRKIKISKGLTTP